MKRLHSFAPTVRIVGLTCLLAAPGYLLVRAQNRLTYSLVAQDSGHIALGLALRKLNVSGTFMQAPAHPDDERRSAKPS